MADSFLLGTEPTREPCLLRKVHLLEFFVTDSPRGKGLFFRMQDGCRQICGALPERGLMTNIVVQPVKLVSRVDGKENAVR